MWIAYHLSLRLAAPVHIGWRAYGNVKQTRPCVPGRTLWGAMTARLARDHWDCDYRKAAAWVAASLRFGYLYPGDGEPAAGPGLWPWGAGADEFVWRFLDSYMSTALRDGRSKEDGSLHEVEFIAPRTRGGQAVWLRGPLWLASAQAGTAAGLRSLLESLVLGAERGYGWGRISEARLEALPPGSPIRGTGWIWSLENGAVHVLNPASDTALTAHLNLPPGAGAPRGLREFSVEPVVGRTTPLSGPRDRSGAEIAAAQLCAVPGSLALKGQNFSVGPLGVWQSEPETA